MQCRRKNSTCNSQPFLCVTMLGALCKDPRHFMNQHDLLSMLQHHESNDDQIFALSTLAVCSMGEHLRKRQIRQLIDISLESNQNIGEE